MIHLDFDKYIDAVDACRVIRPQGRVSQVVGLIARGDSLGLGVGSLCQMENNTGEKITAEIIGFKDEQALFMPYGNIRGIRAGSRITPVNAAPVAPVGDSLLGRVIDGMGHPIDSKGRIDCRVEYPLYGRPVNPMARKTIDELLDVGIASINTMVPLGQGQRMAIMAGSGVGKSVLMGMMTRHTKADVVVIGLIGERGREVKDFVNTILQEEGLERSVVVAATSDSPPLVRIRGAYLATTIAEYFRDQGKHVLLMLDSITRFAMSSRDIGLAAGEPPTSRGYTPSFFVQIPVLLERAGNMENGGSITGVYTVLVEGDDLNDPVGDTVRSIVDGHIVLSRDLANRGHYPAIDVLASVSRVAREVTPPEFLPVREKAVRVISTYRNAEDMISIGAYVDGSDPAIDEAKILMPGIERFLQQDMASKRDMALCMKQLRQVLKMDKDTKAGNEKV